ncbi:hypothetical protein EYZ11_004463 [Aspergillus tanneri]|uniref:Type I Polyketide synthases (Type I PKS) n=1 Tax=Aspergillus tanneri TaxID=1220188 RepID=A0A4S3JKR7_9EURO|nr:hypothetical protein EYZ11_004463 [Aspergillus tanneri]
MGTHNVPGRFKNSYTFTTEPGCTQEAGLPFLRTAADQIQTLWPTFVEAFPGVQKLPGDSSLNAFTRYINGHELPELDQSPTPNILLNLLTVLFHAVDFWQLSREVQSNVFSSVAGDSPLYLRDIQGFCIGFLTAAAVSSAKSEISFQRNITAALCIAAGVGTLVDLNNTTDPAASVSVGWNSKSEYETLLGIIAEYKDSYISCVTDENRITITLPDRDVGTLLQEASDLGFSSQSIGLAGRYHSRSTHEQSAILFRELCKRDSRFQLPDASELTLPLRSNIDGSIISGSLHDVAIDSILLHQCQWFQVVQGAISTKAREADHIMSVGSMTAIPRSVARGRIYNHKPVGPVTSDLNRVPDGVSHRIPNGRIASTELNGPEAPDAADSPAIAIIGMACRYPEAENLEEFWELMQSGRSAVRPLPEDRFKPSELKREPKGPFWGNFLRNPDLFDHRFFGISGREAKSMDPQQRLLLQVAYEALESSGYFGLRNSVDNDCSNVGCYIGVGSVDYGDNVASHDATAFSALGTLRAFISGRVSHHFGWTGPSITYDTACSSGAVAIHSAVNALKTNEASMAIAGGVNVITSPALYQVLSAASFLSPTGASKAFDSEANGYCRGEGAGIVVLKTLSRALADGDSILAVIRGSAVNQGANCTPITVPVSESQAALYRKALSLSGIDPGDVTYVEAHGTGTPVGDPIECESIRQAFGGSQREHQLFVGSVKDNIGHTEAASGVAAVIKTVLMMQKRMIPKQANFNRLNPKIPPLEPDRMAIPQRTERWVSPRRVAVVNNYGAAGSNVAIVVEDPMSVKTRNSSFAVANGVNHSAPSAVPVFISAKSPQGLREYCAALSLRLPAIRQQHSVETAHALAYNLSLKQNRQLDYHYTFTASTADELAAKLDQPDESHFNQCSGHQRPVILCIGGQNGRTAHVDPSIYVECPPFKRHLDICEGVCQALGLPSLFPTIFHPEPIEDLVLLHCVLFSLQYSCAKSFLSAGLKIDTIIGHSFGQLTALVVADAVSLEDGLRLISERARLIQSSWGTETGAMLSVQGAHGEIQQLLESAKRRHPSLVVDIACFNGPETTVLAGPQTSIDAVEETSASEGFSSRIKLTRLPNTHAFHSRLVDAIVPRLREIASSIRYKKPSCRIEACSEDQDWTQLINAEMIVQHSRMPVHFHHAVQRIVRRSENCIWLEAGSNSPIIPMVRRALGATDAAGGSVFQAVDLRTPHGLSNLSKCTASLWSAGVRVQHWPFYQGQESQLRWINLPPYQFQKTSHWLQYIPPGAAMHEAASTTAKEGPEPLLSLVERDDRGATFQVNCWHALFRLCTEGHAVLGQSLCPASMYVEIIMQAATQLPGDRVSMAACHIRDLKISSPLSISSNREVFLQLQPHEKERSTWEFSVTSRSSNQQNGTSSAKHASGAVCMDSPDKRFPGSSMQSLKRLVSQVRRKDMSSTPGTNVLNGKTIVYRTFRQVVDYAPYYRGVDHLISKGNEAVGLIRVPAGQDPILQETRCDPITLDNFLQVAGIHVNCLSDRMDNEVYVCTELGYLLLSDSFFARRGEMESWDVYTTFEQISANRLVNDILIFDPNTGDLLAMFIGATFHGLPMKSLAKTLAGLNAEEHSSDIQGSRGTTLNRSLQQVPSDAQVNGRMNSVELDKTQLLGQLCQLLSRVTEVPVDEIQPSTALTDIGIDSLMSTEVLNEIRRQYKVDIPASDFLAQENVHAIAQYLHSSSSTMEVNGESIPHQVNGNATKTSSFGSTQEMLSDLLEIPKSEIRADMLLMDLGVDSLMSAEVLSEVQKRFGVTIATDEFQALQRVGDLAGRLQASHVSTSGTFNPSPSGVIGTKEALITEQAGAQALESTPSTNSFISVAQEIFAHSRSNGDVFFQRTQFSNFCHSVLPVQMELVVAYIVEAFNRLGCPLATMAAEEVVPNVSVLPRHHKLKNQIYKILEEASLVQRDSSGQFRRTGTPVPGTDSGHLQQSIVSRFPQHTYEHTLLASTGSKLADCLTGKADPLEILFGSPKSRALLENVYTHAPMFEAGTISLTKYLVDIFQTFDDNRPVRILEIGAGTGGTSKHLVESLLTTQKPFEYTFSDISSSLVAAARKKFSQYSFMRYAVVNIEEESATKLYSQYDIVIATNCIHATKDLVRSCTNIRKLLQPKGLLCLVELTRNLFWFDIVFGLLDGWWRFEDGRRHALASETLWRKYLTQASFRWVDWTVGTTDESSILRVIVASPAEAAQATTETVEFKRVGDVSLQADIYYPKHVPERSGTLPVGEEQHQLCGKIVASPD